MARYTDWRTIVIVILAIGGPIGLWFYRDYTLTRELRAEFDAIRSRGEPLTWRDTTPRPVPDDQNAAVIYQKVLRVDRDTGWDASLLPGIEWSAYDVFDRFSADPSETNARAVRDYLSDPQREWCLQTLREGSLRPYCVFPAPWDQSMIVRVSSSLRWPSTRLMLEKANLAAYDGDIEGALRWHATVVRMSDHCDGPPTAYASLGASVIRSSCFNLLRRTLKHAEVPRGAARELDEALSALDPRAAMGRALAGERAQTLDDFDELDYWLGEGLPWPWSSEAFHRYVVKPSGPAFNPVRKADKLEFLRTMARKAELVNEPYHRAADGLDALERHVNALPAWRAPATRCIGDLYIRDVRRVSREEADITMCRLVLGLKDYRRNAGEYPSSLAGLQRSLGWKIPLDPFSGGPYRYRLQGDGFILYSLGPDLDDDGGRPRGRDGDGDIVWECTR